MKKMLLIVDVQNDFVSGSLGSEYAQTVVAPNVIDLAKQFNKSDIFATMDTHEENYLDTSEGKKLPVKHCIKNTWGHDLISELEPFVERTHCLLKNTFGYNPYTLSRLFTDYDEIHICGLCTDICVVSNALILKASNPDKKIIIHANACGGTSKENHDAAIQVMKSCQLDIM